jgi:Flp pilus assembly protein TadD
MALSSRAAHIRRFTPIILSKTVETANTSPTPDSLCQQGIDALASGDAVSAARFFRSAIDRDGEHIEAHHGLIRALRDCGKLEDSIGIALRLTALTPSDPLAHAALSISLQHAGHIPQAEAAATRARILEWKQQLASPPTDGNLQ